MSNFPVSVLLLVAILFNQEAFSSRHRRYHRGHWWSRQEVVDPDYKKVAPKYNPWDNKCGHNKYWQPSDSYRNSHSNVRIVNGRYALPQEFPWQVSVDHGCGGSLISGGLVVTAAHCIGTNKDIYIGFTNIMEDTKHSITASIAPFGIYKHARYDIAMIKLSKSSLSKLFYDDYVRPICLPESCENTCQAGETILASGWGATGNPESTDYLRKTDLVITPDAQCSKQDSDEEIFCADENPAVHPNGTGVGFGDSGGPAMCFKNGYFTLDGVTALVGGHAWPDSYWSGFVKVCYVLDWIRHIIRIEQNREEGRDYSYENRNDY